MRAEIIKTPTKNPMTVMFRFIPENVADDKFVKSADAALRGMNALHTTPVIDDRISFSLIFTKATKRAGL